MAFSINEPTADPIAGGVNAPGGATSGIGGSGGLTPQQQAAIQAAIGQSPQGQSGTQINQNIIASLTQSGLFNPSQLESLQNDGITGGGIWNSSTPGGGWEQQVTSELQTAPDAASGQSNSGLPTPGSIAAPTDTSGASATTGTAPYSGTAPAPLQSFGPLASVTPTYASAATVDPNQQYGYLQAQEQANAASLQPTFAQQDQTNEDQLKARGISSSGAAADLTNQLYGEQAATLAGMNAPAIGQQAGYTQGDITQNQANEQAVNLTNAGYGNAATAANAGYYNQAQTGNASNYNNYLATLEQQGYNTGNEAYEAYLGSFGPNPGVTGGYNTAVGAGGSTYGSVYNTGQQGENNQSQAAGQAAG